MIRFALTCEHDHRWDAWFASGDGYEDQVARGLVECPVCGSTAVRKAPMAPAIVTARAAEPKAPVATPPDVTDAPEPVRAFFEQWRKHVAANYAYVGDAFAEEARDIHESGEERLIYGETTPEEARALIEDGVPVAPLPTLASPQAVKRLN
jgi:hypothetical protein